MQIKPIYPKAQRRKERRLLHEKCHLGTWKNSSKFKGYQSYLVYLKETIDGSLYGVLQLGLCLNIKFVPRGTMFQDHSLRVRNGNKMKLVFHRDYSYFLSYFLLCGVLFRVRTFKDATRNVSKLEHSYSHQRPLLLFYVNNPHITFF